MTNDYTELKRKAEAATPGPWRYDRKGGNYIYAGNDSILGDDCYYPWVPDARTIEYIAAASPDVVLALIERVKELERDAGRLDWIQRHLFGHSWNGVIDSGSRTSWSIYSGFRHETAKMVGDTFRSAIDAAMKDAK